jgi:hypothetical protein
MVSQEARVALEERGPETFTLQHERAPDHLAFAFAELRGAPHQRARLGERHQASVVVGLTRASTIAVATCRERPLSFGFVALTRAPCHGAP